jgi:hypothetical protein
VLIFASNAASGFWQLGWMCGGQSLMRPLNFSHAGTPV